MEVSIEQRIGKLPQELQDEILELYLLLPEDIEIALTNDYKPPPQLQINRKSRKENIELYYDEAIRIIFTDCKLVGKWLLSLDLDNFQVDRTYYHKDPKRDLIENGDDKQELEDLAEASQLRWSFNGAIPRYHPHDVYKEARAGDCNFLFNFVEFDPETGHRKFIYREWEDMEVRGIYLVRDLYD